MSSSSAFHLTFGVELEFLLAYFPEPETRAIRERKTKGLWLERDQFEHVSNEEWAQRSEVAFALRSAGLAVNSRSEKGYDKWTVTSDGSVKPGPCDCTNMNPTWANGITDHLTPEQRAKLRYVNCEVVSPVLDWSSNQINQMEDIIRAINVIKTFRAFCPQSSGLHVHLGNREDGFPLATVKKFAMLVHCFEDQMNQLHPADRLNNQYCVLPRFAFELHERSPRQMIDIIEKFETKAAVVDFMTSERMEPRLPWHYRAYNFGNIMEFSKNTIEFRQHMGTLDPLTIKRWVSLAGELMLVAHKMDSKSLIRFILTSSKKADFTVLDLLRDLNLGSLADAYRNYIYHHSGVSYKDPWLLDEDDRGNDDNDDEYSGSE